MTSDLEKKLKDLRKNAALEQTETYIQIDCKRMNGILNNTIKELKIVLSLPMLIENNHELLSTMLSEDELKVAEASIDSYTQWSEEPRETNRRVSQFYASSTSSFEQFVNKYRIQNPPFGKREHQQLCHLIQILLSNQKVIDFCCSNLGDLLLSNAARDLISRMESLIYFINERLKITPQDEVGREVELTQIYRENEVAKENIGELKKKIQKQTEESMLIIGQLDESIQKITEEIKDIRKSCNEQIMEYNAQAEKKMIWDWKNSEYRQEQLIIYAKRSSADLDVLLKKNQVIEKGLISKRYKLESQLIAQIEKYDTDKVDRQGTLDSLKENHKKQEEDLRMYRKIFDEQEREYEALMTEKKEYEKMILGEKLYVIQSSIAARKIQRYFRYYRELQRQFGKPIKKKEKKKKK